MFAWNEAPGRTSIDEASGTGGSHRARRGGPLRRAERSRGDRRVSRRALHGLGPRHGAISTSIGSTSLLVLDLVHVVVEGQPLVLAIELSGSYPLQYCPSSHGPRQTCVHVEGGSAAAGTSQRSGLCECCLEPDEISDRFLVRTRNRNAGQLAGAKQPRQLGASRRSVFTRSPARTGIRSGAITSQATPIFVSCLYSSNPHGPAS